jgi:hypothetical protein
MDPFNFPEAHGSRHEHVRHMRENYQLETKYDDSFFNDDAPDDALFGSRIRAAKAVTGYAPVNGLKMYYEITAVGEPVVLLHGAFMAITDDWNSWISELAKTRNVIAVEMQGHGRTQTSNEILLTKTLPTTWPAARLSQDPKCGPHRLQLGRRRCDGVCDPPSGKSAKGCQHFSTLRPDGWVKEANDFWPTSRGNM